MKVLTFTSLYPNNIWPNHGVFIKERMTRVATQEGCEIKVVAPVPYFPPFKINYRWRFSQVLQQEVREGIEVYHPRYVMIPKVGMALHGWLMFVSVVSLVKKIQRRFNFDLIDAHYVYPDGLAAVLLGRVLEKPVVVSARGSDINVFKDFFLIRRYLQQVLRQAGKIIAVSSALKEVIVQLGIPEEKICVIPNGVDAEKFRPCPQEEARTRLGLPSKRLILSVGNLTANKGFDVLIEALNLLVREAKEEGLHLAIVGEGEFRQELMTKIALLGLGEYVSLVGAVPHHELYLWYNAADLFCLASRREGWPNVVLESLACGTPVLATATGGIPEIVCSERVGVLTQRTAQDIAEGIAHALQNQWHPQVIRQYAEGHGWEKSARRVSQVFHSVLA